MLECEQRAGSCTQDLALTPVVTKALRKRPEPTRRVPSVGVNWKLKPRPAYIYLPVRFRVSVGKVTQRRLPCPWPTECVKPLSHTHTHSVSSHAVDPSPRTDVSTPGVVSAKCHLTHKKGRNANCGAFDDFYRESPRHGRQARGLNAQPLSQPDAFARSTVAPLSRL